MNETAILLRDSVTKVLSDIITKDCRDAAAQGDWSALWQALDELGLAKLMLSEDLGGSAASPAEAFVVIELLGQFAVPCPLAETIISAKILADHGLVPPEGVLSLAPVQPPQRLQLQADAGDWLLNGEIRSVPWGRQADAIALIAWNEDQAMLCITDKSSATVTDRKNLAAEARDNISFNNTPVSAATAVPVQNPELVWQAGALLRSVQIAGALSASLTMTSDYAQQRTQFGRAISKFQAIQQQLANFASEATAAATAARRAFNQIDQTAAGDWEIAAAKIYAGRAATMAAAVAHQVHGAIGFTREYDLQHLTRRLWSWREEFGNESWWSEQLGRQIATAGADNLWPRIAQE